MTRRLGVMKSSIMSPGARACRADEQDQLLMYSQVTKRGASSTANCRRKKKVTRTLTLRRNFCKKASAGDEVPFSRQPRATDAAGGPVAFLPRPARVPLPPPLALNHLPWKLTK
uniref:Uncharacterized protein n=1 Tax=Branchiostoma floridae TaxID=7739 RepID=C3YZC8_BRAFL|eukprot:XP_002598187.1 hypothetical protein BRAFLDRAFT_69513 [Branchiostoma floridae]